MKNDNSRERALITELLKSAPIEQIVKIMGEIEPELTDALLSKCGLTGIRRGIFEALGEWGADNVHVLHSSEQLATVMIINEHFQFPMFMSISPAGRAGMRSHGLRVEVDAAGDVVAVLRFTHPPADDPSRYDNGSEGASAETVDSVPDGTAP